MKVAEIDMKSLKADIFRQIKMFFYGLLAVIFTAYGVHGLSDAINFFALPAIMLGFAFGVAAVCQRRDMEDIRGVLSGER